MILPVQVTFRNMEEDGLEDYIRQQATKLERYYDGITSCRVIIEMRGRHEHGNLYHVRIDVGVPGGELLVKHEPNVHASLQDEEATKKTKRAELGLAHKKPQRAILDAFADMRRRLQEYARKQRGDVKQRAEPLLTANVASLFPEEDHGFLATADDRQVYFHRDSVLNGHFDQLRVGVPVRFAEEMGEKGPQASTVHMVRPQQRAKAAAATGVVTKRTPVRAR